MSIRLRFPTIAILLSIALLAGVHAAPPAAIAQDQPNIPLATAAAQAAFGDVTLESSAATVERGIAVFSASSQGGDVVMARDAGGDWAVWFVSQNPYQLTSLPGDMVVCADGQGLRVRDVPSTAGDILDTLVSDGDRVTAGQFVLTEDGNATDPGYGWYQISEPEIGWVYSQDVEDAALGDNCASRNQQVGG